MEIDYVLRVTATAGSLGSEVSVDLPINIISFLSVDPPPSFDLISNFSPFATSNSTTEIAPPASLRLRETHRTVPDDFPKRRKAVSFSEPSFENTDARRPVLRSHQTQADLRRHIHDPVYLDQASSGPTFQPTVELVSDFRPQLYRRGGLEEQPEPPSHALLRPTHSVAASESQHPPNESPQRPGRFEYHSLAGDHYSLTLDGPNLAATYDSDESGEDSDDGGEYAIHFDDNAALHRASEYAGDSDNEVEHVIGSCRLDGDVGENISRFKDRRPGPDHFAHADHHEVHYRTQLSSDRVAVPSHPFAKKIPTSTPRNHLREKTRPLSLKKTDAQPDRTGSQFQSATLPKLLTHLLPPQQSDSLPNVSRTELNIVRSQEQSGTQRIRRKLVSPGRAKSMLDLRSLVGSRESTFNLTPQLSMDPTASTRLEPSNFSPNDSLLKTTVPSSDDLPEDPDSFSPSTERTTQLPYLQVPRRLVPKKGGIPSSSFGSALAIASSASEMTSPSVYSSSASSPSITSIPTSNTEKSSLPKTGISSVKARIALLEEKNRAIIAAAVPVAGADRSSVILNPKPPAPSGSTHRDSSLHGQVQCDTVQGLPEARAIHDMDNSEDGTRNNGHTVGLGLVPINNQKHRRRPLPDVHRG